MNAKLILERTIELLIVAGHVTQEKVDEARKIAIQLSGEAAEQAEVLSCKRCGRDLGPPAGICPDCMDMPVKMPPLKSQKYHMVPAEET